MSSVDGNISLVHSVTNVRLGNSMEPLTKALGILATNLSILPATGGAVEDLQHPDADELEDAAAFDGDDRSISQIGETDPLGNPLRPKESPILPREQKHLFRYFIDGSLRTYFIATGIEHNRTFPIELAQLGSACLFRRDDGSLKVVGQPDRKLLLLAPAGADGMSPEVWDQLAQAIPTNSGILLENTSQAMKSEEQRTDPRTHAGGKARRAMHKMEVDIISSTDRATPPRSGDCWAILDGGIRLGEFIGKPNVLAVAKSFDKGIRFRFGNKPRERFDITRLLTALPFSHRTTAFRTTDGKVVFWYVRLWDKVDLDYPLMGVVKLEVGSPNAVPVDTELVDTLSRCIVAERSVTPYGRDSRWHCHLYPIFCAENAIKASFYSQEVILGRIRWPSPKQVVSQEEQQ